MHSTIKTTSARRRTVAALGAAVLGLGAALATAAPAQAADRSPQSGTLSWGFKQSFRSYVGSQTAAQPPIGAIPVGQRITLTAPASFDTAGTPAVPGSTSSPNETLPYLLPVAKGTVTDRANLRLESSGGLSYHFPSHFFDVTISNIAVVIKDGKASIHADTDADITQAFGEIPAGHHVHDDLEIGTVANATVDLSGNRVTVSGTGVVLTAAGARALPFYPAGDPLDDFSLTATLADEPAPPAWKPQISVSKTTGFNPAGTETVTVTGTGFNPAANTSTRAPVTVGQPTGIYVVFGKFATAWKPSASAPASARKIITQKWAIPEPSKTQLATDVPSQAPGLVLLAPDGSFTATVEVKADAAATGNYGIYTYAAGGAAANAAQELSVPLSFTGPGDIDIDVNVPTPTPQPGEFVWRVDGGVTAVSLGTAAVNGDHFSATGQLAPVVVTDTRLGAPAWSVSAQVSSFAGPAGASFGGRYLGWTPAVTVAGGGAAAGAPVAPGLTTGDGLAVSRTLGSAAAGHVLGTTTLGAALNLQLPLDTAAGSYKGTLTLTAVG